MSEQYETTSIADREQAAAVLAGVADGVLAGTVRVGDGDDATTVTVPAAIELEVELEVADDEVELEVELEWPVDDDGSEDSADVGSGDDGPEADGSEDDGSGADGSEDDGPEADDSSGGDGTAGEGVDGGDIAVPVDPVVPVGTDDGSGSLARFELYRDRADEWRWRLRHRNGNVIATSGEGYTRKHNARKGIRSVIRNAPGAETRDEG